MSKPTGDLIADVICRTAELGVTITGAGVDDADNTVITAQALDYNEHCPDCGFPGRLRDHTIRRLIDRPIAGYPTRLRIQVPRLRCGNDTCTRKIFTARLRCAESRSKMTTRLETWIVKRIVTDQMSVSAVARALGVGWQLVNDTALAYCRALTVDDPDHLAGVTVIGVDEHKWKHRRGQGEASFVTVIVDLTPIVNTPPGVKPGQARLIDMVAGRSKQVLKDWLEQRDQDFRDCVQVVAMDGFTGYANAIHEALPEATTVMDPFHVVALAGDKLTTCRQRVQHQVTGRRGRSKDPLYKSRRALLTRVGLLTDKQRERLEVLFDDADDTYIAVEVTYDVYQQIIAIYEQKDQKLASFAFERLIEKISTKLPPGLKELGELGRTLKRRRDDVLAYFKHRASNGPVEAINGRLEHLRGIALGFRNLDHYILRSLLHSGGLRKLVNAL